MSDELHNEVNDIIKNGNQVISADGLTLQEVYNTLIVMLDGDLNLLKEVLLYSEIMAICGVSVASESKLSKRDVYRLISNLKDKSISTEIVDLSHNATKNYIKKNKKSQAVGR